MRVESISLFLIAAYQKWISPFLGTHCRFYPSCSQYARKSITQKGVVRGGWLAVKRLSKCHPFHPGGYDVLE